MSANSCANALRSQQLSPSVTAEDVYCNEETPDIARFLFAGQSNMVGHSEQALPGLFNDAVNFANERFLKFETKQKRKRKRKEIRAGLRDVIGSAEAANPISANNEANLIYKLAGARARNKKSRSVLNNDTITVPHPTAVCSFTNPGQSPDLSCEGPVSPTACGYGGTQYGPELMFAHLFTKLKTSYTNKPIGITKVAVGGTRISQWLRPTALEPADPVDPADPGNYWFALQDAIDASHGTIEGFVWFQGENDHFPQTSFEEYLDSLTTLVADVREEIFVAYQTRRSESNEKDRFAVKEDIPVVIVELGPWIGNDISVSQGNAPGNVIRAQREFVNVNEM